MSETWRRTVLLVEDDPDVRLAVLWQLQAAGMHVICAASSQEVATVPPVWDAACVDWQLSGSELDGLQLAQKLRADFDRPVVLVTAAPLSVVKSAKTAGIPMLSKPFLVEPDPVYARPGDQPTLMQAWGWHG